MFFVFFFCFFVFLSLKALLEKLILFSQVSSVVNNTELCHEISPTGQSHTPQPRITAGPL